MSGPVRKIWCCGCNANVTARLTDGAEIYPHRKDLAELPFWKCDACGNFVGTHHKTDDRTKPLGCIPTKEIREARKHIHNLIDPLWKSRKIGRRDLYGRMSDALGYEYHTAEIRSVEEARRIWKIARLLANEVRHG